MSLVNYSSDEEEADDLEEEQNTEGKDQLRALVVSSSSTPSVTAFPSFSLTSSQGAQDMVHNSMNSSVRAPVELPNVSELLHSCRSMQDAVMGNSPGNKSILRKRPDDRPVATSLGKIPKTSKISTRRISSDIAKGSLLPPQLGGRSNIATEDLDKLFSRRQKTNL